jgi:hypothetical protein
MDKVFLAFSAGLLKVVFCEKSKKYYSNNILLFKEKREHNGHKSVFVGVLRKNEKKSLKHKMCLFSIDIY